MIGLSSGNLIPHPQSANQKESLRCLPRLPEDGEINWFPSAKNIVRLVQASAEPFSGAFTHHNENRLVIWWARSGLINYPHVGVPGQVVNIDRLSRTVTVLAGEGVVVLKELTIGDERWEKLRKLFLRLRFAFQEIPMHNYHNRRTVCKHLKKLFGRT